jgi:hypothetical protein
VGSSAIKIEGDEEGQRDQNSLSLAEADLPGLVPQDCLGGSLQLYLFQALL